MPRVVLGTGTGSRLVGAGGDRGNSANCCRPRSIEDVLKNARKKERVGILCCASAWRRASHGASPAGSGTATCRSCLLRVVMSMQEQGGMGGIEVTVRPGGSGAMTIWWAVRDSVGLLLDAGAGAAGAWHTQEGGGAVGRHGARR